jgi:hypothetical protein
MGLEGGGLSVSAACPPHMIRIWPQLLANGHCFTFPCLIIYLSIFFIICYPIVRKVNFPVNVHNRTAVKKKFLHFFIGVTEPELTPQKDMCYNVPHKYYQKII